MDEFEQRKTEKPAQVGPQASSDTAVIADPDALRSILDERLAEHLRGGPDSLRHVGQRLVTDLLSKIEGTGDALRALDLAVETLALLERHQKAELTAFWAEYRNLLKDGKTFEAEAHEQGSPPVGLPALSKLAANAPTLEHFSQACATAIDVMSRNISADSDPAMVYAVGEIFSQTQLLLDRLPELREPGRFSQFHAALRESLVKEDSASRVLLRGGNIWSTEAAAGGIAYFASKALSSDFSPASLHELTRLAKDVPGTNLARLEQNRRDALDFQGFANFRDHIHDQLPGCHELVQAALQFARTGDASAFVRFRERHPDGVPGIEQIPHEAYLRDSVRGERLITVLERLERNTAPVQDRRPLTGIGPIDAALGELGRRASGMIDTLALSEALRSVNAYLAEANERGASGVEPSLVLALGWLEQKACEAFRQQITSAESNARLLAVQREEWFTGSLELYMRVNAAEPIGEDAIGKLKERIANAGNPEAAFGLAAGTVLENVRLLADRYGQNGLQAQSGALFSGNLADAFIMANDGVLPSRRLRRTQELIEQSARGAAQAEALLRAPALGTIGARAQPVEFVSVSPGENPLVDGMLSIEDRFATGTVGEIVGLQNRERAKWEIGNLLHDTLRSRAVERFGIAIDGRETRLDLVRGQINGRSFEAVVLENTLAHFGTLSVAGEQIRDGLQAMEALNLERLYRISFKEGD